MTMPLEIWGVKDPNISAQLALAAQRDMFQQEAGLDVACRFIESGTTMAADILSAAQKPFAFTQTPITAMLLREQGCGVKIVAPLADIAGAQQLVLRNADGIIHPRDLERKRIGMAKRSAIYVAIEKMARDYGVDLQKIEFVDLLPHDQLAAFLNGELDAMACWEPWTSKAKSKGGTVYFSGARSEIPGMEGNVSWLVNQSCLIAPEEHLQAHADELVAMLGTLRKATEMLNHERKEVSKDLADFFGISRVELLTVLNENAYSLRMDNLFRIGVLEFRDFLHKTGQISSRFAEQMLYDSSLLRELDPSLVALEETAAQSLSIIQKGGIYYPSEMKLSGNNLRLRFLLADDSRYVRKMLTQAVRVIGGEILGEATSGSEAVEMFTRLRPNVVTMDLSMPGVSGLDAIKRILELDPEVNIIVVSGADLEEVRNEVFELGVKIFITKPFDPALVAEIVGLLLF